MAAADEIRLAQTASRSVLGVMNEFAHLARHYLRDSQLPQDLMDVSPSRTPTSPLYARHGFPDRELQAIAAEQGLG